MKHWTKDIFTYNDQKGWLSLVDSSNNVGRVLAVDIKDGKVIFIEACDSWFAIEKTKEDAIDALQELIQYIKAT